MKTCSKCKKEKPISDFSYNRSAKDGKMHRCKNCNRKIVKAYYEKEHGTEQQRQSRQSTLYLYIKHLRDNKKKTLKEIAADTGLDESSISYYLSGKRSVGMEAVRKFENKAKRDDRGR